MENRKPSLGPGMSWKEALTNQSDYIKASYWPCKIHPTGEEVNIASAFNENLTYKTRYKVNIFEKYSSNQWVLEKQVDGDSKHFLFEGKLYDLLDNKTLLPLNMDFDSETCGRCYQVELEAKKLRLVLFEECHRSCKGCCNEDFDLRNLPVCESYKGFELIMLTGGEPMLRPEKVKEAVRRIRRETDAPIILYTALTVDKETLSQIIGQIDGITVTLHDNSDVKPFLEFDDYHVGTRGRSKSYRLNVFSGIEIDLGNVKGKWKVKSDIEWIKNCPLPEGEVLMRFESGERMREVCRP